MVQEWTSFTSLKLEYPAWSVSVEAFSLFDLSRSWVEIGAA